MILIVGKDNKIKDVIEETKFSELGIWERKHVEEWILEYPEILGEDLLIVTTEYDRFDKTKDRLDILAIDKNGKLVVIELKRDVADRFADLQAIHYAAYMRVRLRNPSFHQPLSFDIWIAPVTDINIVQGKHIEFKPHAFKNFG